MRVVNFEFHLIGALHRLLQPHRTSGAVQLTFSVESQCLESLMLCQHFHDFKPPYYRISYFLEIHSVRASDLGPDAAYRKQRNVRLEACEGLVLNL